VTAKPPGYKQHRDEVILDTAASLFARYGFAQTSLQSIADEVGYSKAGLLHHYPSKVAIYDAVLEHSKAAMRRIQGKLAGQPGGPARDRDAIRMLVDLALVQPGLVALLLGTAVPLGAGESSPELSEIGLLLFRTFDEEVPAIERTIRVVGALGALGVLSLTALQADDASGWRDHIISTSYDTLGHTSSS
jgi:AcrR family transcriptional regulator